MTSYDTAVIGGGLLGCATAWHLARAGNRVLLVEKDQVNRHASGQNAGSLHFQLEFRMVEHGDDAARAAARALRCTWTPCGPGPPSRTSSVSGAGCPVPAG